MHRHTSSDTHLKVTQKSLQVIPVIAIVILQLYWVNVANATNGFLDKAIKQTPQGSATIQTVETQSTSSTAIKETTATPEPAAKIATEPPALSSKEAENNAVIQLTPATPAALSEWQTRESIEPNAQYTEDQFTQDPIDTQPLPNLTLVESEKVAGNVWDRVFSGFKMKPLNTKSVKLYEKRFTKNPKLFNEMINRSEKYLFHIVTELEKRNMPTELALVPIIESAYNPIARSGSAADGIWQIIPSTGRNFGLKQNWWKDERRDIQEATDAALNYLQKLHDMFGSWQLTLAAYNAGEGTVSRAIKSNKKAGDKIDYTKLRLPAETKQYIPKLQAIKNILLNPEKFGVSIKSVEDKPYFKAVSAPAQIDTLLVAELAGISDSEFYALNPHFKRPVIASTEQKNTLLLPVEAVETFENNLSFYNKPLVTWQPYTLKPGEALSSVANQFGIQLNELRKANQLPSQLSITKPMIILVPNAEAKTATENSNAHTANEASDATISTISAINETQTSENLDKKTIEDLKNNHLNIAKKTEKTNASQKKTSHIVKRGETLSAISQKYNVSTQQIVALNHLRSERIKIGQKLLIKD